MSKNDILDLYPTNFDIIDTLSVPDNQTFPLMIFPDYQPTLITETVLLSELVTYTFVPSGLTATLEGW